MRPWNPENAGCYIQISISTRGLIKNYLLTTTIATCFCFGLTRGRAIVSIQGGAVIYILFTETMAAIKGSRRLYPLQK